jgi:pimeloyl-ACP methyl ester carboxylesterase
VDPPVDWIQMNRQQAYLLRGAHHLSKLGGVLARLGVVRACVELLTGGAPAAPRQFIKIFGPVTARTIERLVGEIRKLPPEVHPFVQAAWCRPQCFDAMAEYLRVFEQSAAAAATCRLPSDIPLVVISAGDQPDDVKAAHSRLARSSTRGRHIVAEESGHWVPFDQPELIVDAIRELIEMNARASDWHGG